MFYISTHHIGRIVVGGGGRRLDGPSRRRRQHPKAPSRPPLGGPSLVALGNVYIHFYRLTLLEGEVQLGLRLLVLLRYLLLLLDPLEVVLQGHVEVETVGSVGEPHPDESAAAALVHDLDDEVPRAVRDGLHGGTRVRVHGARSEQFTGAFVLKFKTNLQSYVVIMY